VIISLQTYFTDETLIIIEKYKTCGQMNHCAGVLPMICPRDTSMCLTQDLTKEPCMQIRFWNSTLTVGNYTGPWVCGVW